MFMKVTDEESAHSAREITRREGMFVGYSLELFCKPPQKKVTDVNKMHKRSVLAIEYLTTKYSSKNATKSKTET
jgi:cysteine synthase